MLHLEREMVGSSSRVSAGSVQFATACGLLRGRPAVRFISVITHQLFPTMREVRQEEPSRSYHQEVSNEVTSEISVNFLPSPSAVPPPGARK